MKIQKKKNWGAGRGVQGGCERNVGVGGPVVGWGGVGLMGVRVDVIAMLGVGGDVGYGGCEPRIEGIVQYTKRYCTILKKNIKKCGGRGRGRLVTSLNIIFF